MTKAGKCVAWRSVGQGFCWDGPGPATTWRDCSSGMQQKSYILNNMKKIVLADFLSRFFAPNAASNIFCDMQKSVSPENFVV